MWRRLEEAAKTATANASGIMNAAQERAQVLAASVREEAASLLQAIGTIRPGPVDDILYEEIEDYKVFVEEFQIDTHTDEISQILEEDDEIRGLHEEMVPVQISYEEFWSRYFFRREQELLRQREEAERLEREQDEAAARLQVLEDFDMGAIEGDDDDDDDADNAAEDTLKEGEEAASVEDAEAAQEALRKLRQEAKTNRKAAKLWKQKAIEFQKQLGVMAAKFAEEKDNLQRTMEAKLHSMSDAYENKITEATLQIDEARAAGFDVGIQESEAIVASVQEQSDMEIAQLKSLLVEMEHRAASGDSNALEQQVADAKKEADLWKARAIKMKKLKDQLESGDSTPETADVGALRAENERLASELAAATTKCSEIKDTAYAEGIKAGKDELDTTTSSLKKEIETLQLELQALRIPASSSSTAAVPSAGDVLAQADAVLSSVEADPLVLGTSGVAEPTAARDDWGEW